MKSDLVFFGDRVAVYHEGKYARELKGDGSLALTSDPPALGRSGGGEGALAVCQTR